MTDKNGNCDRLSLTSVGPAAPAHIVERFTSLGLPDPLLHVWRTVGFAGFSRGRLWLTDPYQWAPVVEAWLENMPLPFEDQWWCISREALGGMRLWGENTGFSLEIWPFMGWICPRPSAANNIATSIQEGAPPSLYIPLIDIFGDDEKEIVPYLLDVHGDLDSSHMYGPILATDIDEQPWRNVPWVAPFYPQMAIPYLIEAASLCDREIPLSFSFD